VCKEDTTAPWHESESEPEAPCLQFFDIMSVLLEMEEAGSVPAGALDESGDIVQVRVFVSWALTRAHPHAAHTRNYARTTTNTQTPTHTGHIQTHREASESCMQFSAPSAHFLPRDFMWLQIH